MKRTFRYLALWLAVCGTVFWAARGANPGWTKTTISVTVFDEVTGLEGVDYQDRFVPGVDFLGASLGLAGLVFGVSFLLSQKPSKNPETPKYTHAR